MSTLRTSIRRARAPRTAGFWLSYTFVFTIYAVVCGLALELDGLTEGGRTTIEIARAAGILIAALCARRCIRRLRRR